MVKERSSYPVLADQKARKQRDAVKRREERRTERAVRSLQSDASARQTLDSKIEKLQTRKRLQGHQKKQLRELQKLRAASTRKDLERAAALRVELEKSGLTRELEAIARGDEIAVSDDENLQIDEGTVNWGELGPQEALSLKAQAGLVDVEAIKKLRRERAEGQGNWMVEQVAMEASGNVAVKSRREDIPSAFELGDAEAYNEFEQPVDFISQQETVISELRYGNVPVWKRLRAEDGWIDIDDLSQVPPPPKLPSRPKVAKPPPQPIQISAPEMISIPPPPVEPPPPEPSQRTANVGARDSSAAPVGEEETRNEEVPQRLMAPSVVRIQKRLG